ncbi:MAG: 4Fe-4S binding protein [Methanomassiliicoccales archaeon]
MGRKTDVSTVVIKETFRERFLLARFTRIPVLGRLIIRTFFDEDKMMYLPKDDVVAGLQKKTRTIQIGIVAEPKNVVLPSRIVEYFIKESRYIFIMNRCICRTSNKCKDYPRNLGCIFLGKGVLKIPEKMGRMATQQEALGYLKRAREAGLVHLIGRNKIDSVWLDTGPKEDLLSICSCCPCCCLWKMIPYLSPGVSDGITRMPGVDVLVNEDECVGCGACVKDDVCFVKAISVEAGKARVDMGLCKGCGRCVEVCRQRAIELRIEDQAYFEKSIETIEPLVDVKSE